MTTPPEPPATRDELAALLAELHLTDPDEVQRADLDAAVVEAKEDEAAGINNGGVLAQAVYLCEDMPLAEARSYLLDFADTPEEEPE
jgi:hypothetical protein